MTIGIAGPFNPESIKNFFYQEVDSLIVQIIASYVNTYAKALSPVIDNASCLIHPIQQETDDE